MSRYFIDLAYSGKNYHGWQIQDNANSIQEMINKGLSYLVKNDVNIVGCGRTDAGVHARQFYAHFDIDSYFDQEKLDELVFKINRYLPTDIVVYSIFRVPSEAHARFDAISRTYEYFIVRRKDPFLEDFSWLLYGDLEIELMNSAAEKLYDFQDFTSFSKLHTQVKTNICRIEHARWEQKDHLLIFKIKADRFLRNMVRAIVGTLLEVGAKKITVEGFVRIIESKDRSEAGLSVPARGLFLSDVEYPESITSMMKVRC